MRNIYSNALANVAHFIAQHKAPKCIAVSLANHAYTVMYPHNAYMQYLCKDMFLDMYY